MKLIVKVDSEGAKAAFAKAPGLVTNEVDGALGAGAQTIAAAARVNVSKVFSTLVNSIIAAKVAPMHYEVRAGANYARAVEEGTGPAVGRRAYMPDPRNLMAFVKKTAGINWRGRPGGPTRRAQMDDVRDRAWALAAHIRKHGTKAHPYMAPALEEKRDVVHRSVLEAVERGIQMAARA